MDASTAAGKEPLEQGVDDLSDVIIVRPTPMLYSITEVEGAEFVLRQTGLGVPWTGDTLVQFMEALGAAWEAKAELERAEATPAAHMKGGVGSAASKANRLTRVKLLLKNGDSIIDIPAILGWTFDELINLVVGGNKRARVREWVDTDWLFFEAAIAGDGPFKLAPLAKQFGLTFRGTETLLGLYSKAVSYEARNLSNAMTPLIAAAVAENPNINTAEMRTLLEEAGLTPPKNSALRQRLRDARRSCGAERVVGARRDGVLTPSVV